jgi:hypothetical protein
LPVGVDESPVKDSLHICLPGAIHTTHQKQFELGGCVRGIKVEEVLDEEDGAIRGIVTTGLVTVEDRFEQVFGEV